MRHLLLLALLIPSLTFGSFISTAGSPLTTKGDVFTYDTANCRLGVGSDGQFLTADAASACGLKWAAGYTSPVTTKGDILGYSTVAARVPVGTNGQILTADSTQALGIKWAPAGAGTGNVTTINTDATPAQTLTVGTTGTDFVIVDNAAGDHKFNLPDASATARGVVSTGTQTFAGNKSWSGTTLTFGPASNTGTHTMKASTLTLQQNAATDEFVVQGGQGAGDLGLYSSASSGTVIRLYGHTHATLADTIKILNANGTIATLTDAVASFPGTTASTTTATGSLTTGGGIGAIGQVTAGGALKTTLTTDSTTTSTGSIIAAGGLGIAKAAFIGGALNVTDATASTTVSTGSGIFGGGVGVAGQVTAGGALKTTVTTDASSTTTGSVIAAGGLGVAKKSYLGDQVTVTSGKPILAGTYHLEPLEYDAGNSSTTQTLDWSNGSSQKSTLTGNVTYTLSNPVAGGTYVIKISTGAGSFTTTWPAAVHWSGATPTTTATASKIDIVTCYYDGSTYFCQDVQNFAP